ncbi:MAG: hypothetical protein QOJ40_2044 [Verrucomicrobiota bacterium]
MDPDEKQFSTGATASTKQSLIIYFWATLAFMAVGADRATVINDPAESRAFKARYLALTDSWVKGIVFTPDEERSMREGKQWEEAMNNGPDDPLGKRIRAAGECSFAALAAAYPGKILDRTILGTYTDPGAPLDSYHDEFSIYWNGAIAANLMKGRRSDGPGATGLSQIGHNTVIEFRVGADAELFGRVRSRYSSIGYEDGYLPLVTATYERDGLRYTETAFAHQPKQETGGWDIGYVRVAVTNTTGAPQTALLTEHIVLNDGGQVRYEAGQLLDSNGAILAVVDDARASFDTATARLRHTFALAPGASAKVHLKIPYVPDGRKLLKAASVSDFNNAHETQKTFWEGLLAKGARVEVPEPRINNVYRALLAQNFILADGPRFTYGSGLRYNDSTFPQENGFGTHVFAMYGFKDYADQMQRYFLAMCVTPKGAGRKYQNRRAMVLHHLLENYRFTGKTDLFDQFKNDYFRVADEIVSDRHSTMTEPSGEKPLYWGLLPPDKPGADVEASTQRVYVPGHNINNCQGLQDFGRFLVITGLDRARGESYLREAADFRKTLMSAMRRGAIRLPGRPPFLDLQTLLFRDTPDYGPDPYDDLVLGRLQGTYFHYWVDMEFHYNFFNPKDDVGQWLADYVRERNGLVLGLCRARRQTGNAWGWVNNVYDGGYYNYRLRQGNVEEFLYGLYSRLAFGMSRYTYVASEGSPFIGYNTENGGYVGADYSFPNSAANADTLHMLRNALVYEELADNIETGTLCLLKGVPRKWLERGKQIRVERLATYYGDLSFTVDSGAADRVIRAKVDSPSGRWKKIEIALRHPASETPRSVRVNGAPHSDFDSRGNVRLSPGAASYLIEVRY